MTRFLNSKLKGEDLLIFVNFEGRLYRKKYGKPRLDGTRKVYWRCRRQQDGCPGGLSDGVSSPHMDTCQPDPEAIAHLQTIVRMKRRCRTEFTFVTRIFEEEKREVFLG